MDLFWLLLRQYSLYVHLECCYLGLNPYKPRMGTNFAEPGFVRASASSEQSAAYLEVESKHSFELSEFLRSHDS